ncbi:FHA domain-containing protein [Streptomyces rapamycinicus]|uniref:FHA domain-containing protein n=1 Tax=Streptomyces rapamycinicus TaxID=1226757 RepID=UPI003D7C2B57
MPLQLPDAHPVSVRPAAGRLRAAAAAGAATARARGAAGPAPDTGRRSAPASAATATGRFRRRRGAHRTRARPARRSAARRPQHGAPQQGTPGHGAPQAPQYGYGYPQAPAPPAQPYGNEGYAPPPQQQGPGHQPPQQQQHPGAPQQQHPGAPQQHPGGAQFGQGGAPVQAPGNWIAVVAPDREYFMAMMNRSGPEAAGLNLPAYSPEQQLPLNGQQITIGRRRHSTGEAPDIDLGRPPEDPGVSHQHALLVQQPDGVWAVVDQDSTNGTTINGGDEPIQPFVPVPLREGDRVHVGAWTTITVRRG